MRKRRILSVILALAMYFAAVPSFALAESEDIAEVIDSSGTMSFDDFNSAIDYAEAGSTVKLLGNVMCDTSVSKEVNITVPNGVTFNVMYSADGIQVMEANITVEEGGEVEFTRYRPNADFSYLVMNGDMTIENGASVKMCPGASGLNDHQSGVVFLGSFVNRGTLDCTNAKNENGVPYIKYDQEAGEILTGFPIYNLCLTMPSDETISNKTIKVTSITGKAEVGETLTAEIDGFGNSANLPEALKKTIIWSDEMFGKGDEYDNVQYTVESADIGHQIGARFKGVKGGDNYLTSVYPYCYMLYKDGELITLRNGESEATAKTETVKSNSTAVYLGGASASDSNSGASAEQAVKSLAAAVNLVNDGGDMILCGDVTAEQFNFITKSVNFKALDKNTKPSLTNTSGMMYMIAYNSNITLSFEGIDFNYENAIFGGFYAGLTLNFNNVQTSGTGRITTMMKNSYQPHNVNIKNSKDLKFDFLVEGTTDHIVTIDNSSITCEEEGSLGKVKLTNGSTLATKQPVQTLTADNANNKLVLLTDDSGKAIPIKIEGGITISETPIELVFDGSLTDGEKLVSSTNGNSAVTVDKFTITKPGVSLKQQGNDILAVIESAAEYSVGYADGKAEIFVPTAGIYTVIFVDYEGGVINKITTEQLNVTADNVGTNTVTPEGITLGTGDKIMLWSSLNGMIPLASAYSLR